MNINEIWKDYFQNQNYQVSTLGNIRSKRFMKNIKPQENSCGYLRVQLSRAGNRKFIHRIVAETFLNKSKKSVVNHIDGNKKNNSVKNLEWCTPKENRIHALKLGLQKSFKGNAKINKVQALEIKQSFRKVNELSIAYNISQRTIRDIKNGITWKSLNS